MSELDPKVWILRDGLTGRFISLGVVQEPTRKYQRRQYVTLNIKQAKALMRDLKKKIVEAEEWPISGRRS